jgi:hypothetical protein
VVSVHTATESGREPGAVMAGRAAVRGTDEMETNDFREARKGVRTHRVVQRAATDCFTKIGLCVLVLLSSCVLVLLSSCVLTTLHALNRCSTL